MRRTLLGAVVIAIGATGSALGADLPLKAPPPVPVSYWNNCYVGGNAGWKWGQFRDGADVPGITGTIGAVATTVPPDTAFLNDQDANSAAAGVQAGCRYETPQHWVVGLEGDFDWTNLQGSSVVIGPGPGTTFVPGADTFNDRLRGESSIRLSVGHSWDRLLVYATGGIAFGSVKMEGIYPATLGGFVTPRIQGLFPASSGSDTQVLVGGTIGAGAAYAINKNWEIGAEYRFTSYQRKDFNLGSVAGACGLVGGVTTCLGQPVTGHKDLQTSEILFKVNYRFDWVGLR